VGDDPAVRAYVLSVMAAEAAIEIEVPVTPAFEKEYDDDGCGSPSCTGNSMTGRRGSYWVCTGVTADLSDAELRKLVESELNEQNESKIRDLQPD